MSTPTNKMTPTATTPPTNLSQKRRPRPSSSSSLRTTVSGPSMPASIAPKLHGVQVALEGRNRVYSFPQPTVSAYVPKVFRDDLRLSDERSRLRADQGHARVARARGGDVARRRRGAAVQKMTE